MGSTLTQYLEEPLIAEPLERVLTSQRVKGLSCVVQDEADSILERWRLDAANDVCCENATKTILSLFDESGVWSAPYVLAGYDVIQVDLQRGVDVMDLTSDLMHDYGIDEVYGILAACPCTHFASCGAKFFAEKDKAGVTLEGIELVHQTMQIIEYFEPEFWAIENPKGRIRKLCGLPSSRLYFHPWHFGDPYTKETYLYGRFNPMLELCPVHPYQGSKVHRLRGDVPEQKKERSLTPEGFAFAFYRANRLLHTNGHSDRNSASVKTSAAKMAKSRAKMRALIENRPSTEWSLRACIEVMTNSRYAKYKRQAWNQYGKLQGFL